MNHKVIQEFMSGKISLRIIQPDKNDFMSRKYWLCAGFGQLELGPDEVLDIENVLSQLGKSRRRSKYVLRYELFGWLGVVFGLLILSITIGIYLGYL